MFTKQLEKAREAVDAANIRSAYAEIMVSALTGEATEEVKEISDTYYIQVYLVQNEENWQNKEIENGLKDLLGDAYDSTGGPYPKSDKGWASLTYYIKDSKLELLFDSQ